MKHRSVMSVIVLSIVTLGIYDLYWLVKVKKELNARTSVHTPTLWLLFLPILLLVPVIILSFIVSSASSGSSAGTGSTALILVAEFLAALAFIPITFYWFFKFSKAVSEYTHGELSTAMNFVLLWLLRFIGMAIIQDKFNDMLAAGGAPTAAPGVPMASTQGQNDAGVQPPAQPMPPANPMG